MNSDHMTRSQSQALIARSVDVLSRKARAITASYAAAIHRRVMSGETITFADGIGRLYRDAA